VMSGGLLQNNQSINERRSVMSPAFLKLCDGYMGFIILIYLAYIWNSLQ